MEIVDRTLDFLRFVQGEIQIGMALGHFGRYIATEDPLYLRLTREELAEADKKGVSTEYARDFIERHR
ncbi:MAG: hypothetical protein HY512_04410 [Candidatus Aenigmarchaeota archaeon]|nr:hypothetical protein [Candidatus Aenigmarchaeota archaeon]